MKEKEKTNTEFEKIMKGIPKAKMTKKGFAFKMSKGTSGEMSQKMKKQDPMFR